MENAPPLRAVLGGAHPGRGDGGHGTSPYSKSARCLPMRGGFGVPPDGTSPHSNSSGCGRREEGLVRRPDGTSPHSNRSRVAFPTLRPPRLEFSWGPAPWTKRGKRTTAGALVLGGIRVAATGGRNIAPFKLLWLWPIMRRIQRAVRSEHRPNQSGAELRFPPFDHRASVFLGNRRRGRSVENARPPVPWFGAGGVRIAARSCGRNIALFICCGMFAEVHNTVDMYSIPA